MYLRLSGNLKSKEREIGKKALCLDLNENIFQNWVPLRLSNNDVLPVANSPAKQKLPVPS